MFITCETPAEACSLNECKSYPKLYALEKYITDIFNENCIKEVSCLAWTHTDRSSLTTQVDESNDFVEDFCNKLFTLKPHLFTTK